MKVKPQNTKKREKRAMWRPVYAPKHLEMCVKNIIMLKREAGVGFKGLGICDVS